MSWRVELEDAVLDSTDSRFRFDAGDLSLSFNDRLQKCNMRLAWHLEEEGRLLALQMDVTNVSEKEIRIRAISPLRSTEREGSGLSFWRANSPRMGLTDEWERCYGHAGIRSADHRLQSAWDIHLTDRAAGTTCSLSYYQIPNTKLSFTVGGTQSGRSTFLARCDASSGRRGVALQPGQSFRLPEMMIRVHHGTVHDALETYAERIARRNQVPSPPRVVPVGWVDWYFAKAKTTEDDILKNLDFIASELADFGLEYIQIDSGWQWGVETTAPPHNVIAGGPWVPNSKFQRGMKWFADEIRKRGFKPGIWIRPFHHVDGSALRKSNPGWFNQNGQMDMSIAEVRGETRNLMRMLTDEWGFEYIKYDFPSFDLFNAWGPDLFEDRSAHESLADPSQTNISSYRKAMETLAEGSRGKAGLLACNSVMPQTLGQAGVFRIGDDVGDWNRTFRYGVRSVSARYYTNGVFWANDPDCVLVREPFSLEQARAWASLVALSGGVVFISEHLPTLPPERLDILKKVMPVYKNEGSGYAFGRPIDLLDNDPPRIWSFHVRRPFGNWHIVGLFNWSEEPVKTGLAFETIGINSTETVHLTDFWRNQSLGNHRGEYGTILQPMCCQVLSVRTVGEHPGLLSTTRHILQGAVEVSAMRWDRQARTLSGTCRVIKDNPYDMRIWCADREIIEQKNAAPLGMISEHVAGFRLESTRTGNLDWQIRFS